MKKKIPSRGGKEVPASPGAARRKKETEYRMLEDGEMKRRGDTFKDSDGKWKRVVYVNEPYNHTWDEPVRRLVTSASKSAKRKARSGHTPRTSKVTPKSPRGAAQEEGKA